jgi:HlyD family secretion protein
MIKIINKIKNFFKRPRNSILTAVAAVILVIIVLLATGGSGTKFETAIASVGTIRQEVSVTGRVKPAQNVDLAFEVPGRIVQTPVKVGQQVYAGQTLMVLDLSELNAQLQREQANVRAAQAQLDQTKGGAREEDLNTTRTNFDNSKLSLVNAAEAALETSLNSIVSLTTIQYKYFTGYSHESLLVASDKGRALYAIFNKNDLDRAIPEFFLGFDSPLKQKIKLLKNNPETGGVNKLAVEIENILSLTSKALDTGNAALNGVQATDAEKALIDAARGNVLAQISAFSTAKSSLKAAAAQLELKTAPATSFDLEISQSQFDQAEANLALVEAQIAKRILRAPISGVVADVHGNVGEISSVTQPAVSLISNSQYEIEVDVPEADIAKVKIGDSASITVDAYGSDIFWSAKVVKIYPAEKVIDGVATYRVVLQFDENDDRIRPGMTANIDIVSGEKSGALTVPQRAIIRKDGGKFVKVLVEKKSGPSSQFANLKSVFEDKEWAIYEMPVETGIRGSDGKIEIISGLKAGETVVTD